MENKKTNPADTLAHAHAPELEWNQVQETVLMMELSVGQIEAAMRDSNNSIEVLTDVFANMAGIVRMIDDTVATLPEEGDSGAAKNNLQNITQQVSDMVNQAIFAFQFYDRLAQRLSHVNHSLALLSKLISDQTRRYNHYQWIALKTSIRSKYTMPEEVEMFEAVLSGMSVEKALENFMQKLNDKPSDEIVFF